MSIPAKLGLTAFFIALNGFFVAAEFALVKIRPSRVQALARRGDRRAKIVQRIYERLDLYLSGCQLGITIASLVLGSLAEPVVATLLLRGVDAMGWSVSGAVVHGAALTIALAIITLLHMILGEQAPKIWALERAESIALRTAKPLLIFVSIFRPAIWLVNVSSGAVLRVLGIKAGGAHDSVHSANELREIIDASAHAGEISVRQRVLADNVLGLMDLEVRHIMLPRVDAAYLSLDDSVEDNLQCIQSSGHSRLPLCRDDLDTVIGMVLVRDVLAPVLAGDKVDLEALAREVLIVPDTQPLSRFIVEAQGTQRHAAIVVDEHGTTVGLAFLEDALEEIVGPLYDELDTGDPEVQELEGGVIRFTGAYPLPDAARVLEIEIDEDSDTIGGYVVSRLGRLPRIGDAIELESYRAVVEAVSLRRINKLRFEPLTVVDQDAASHSPS